MTPRKSFSSLSSDYDAFLFSQVDEDRAGLPLNVMSILARSDVDPWQEAAKLSLLPRETAIRYLMTMIVNQTVPRSPDLRYREISSELIALLPHKTKPGIEAKTVPDTSPMTRTDFFICIISAVIFLAIAVETQLAASQTTNSPAATPASTSGQSATPAGQTAIRPGKTLSRD